MPVLNEVMWVRFYQIGISRDHELPSRVEFQVVIVLNEARIQARMRVQSITGSFVPTIRDGRH